METAKQEGWRRWKGAGKVAPKNDGCYDGRTERCREISGDPVTHQR